MKQVLVINKFKDLVNDEEIRDIGQALLLDDDRAIELIAKGFVKEIVYIDLTTPVDEDDGKGKEPEDVKEEVEAEKGAKKKATKKATKE